MVLKHGATFTGMLVKEDDKEIAIKMCGAEVTWAKSAIKATRRYVARKADDPTCPKPVE